MRYLALLLLPFTLFLSTKLLGQCTTSLDSGGERATSSINFGQSFETSCSGTLNTIAVIGDASTMNHTVTVYQGIGTGGTVLGMISNQSVVLETLSLTDFTKSVFDFSSENIDLLQGVDYTFVISGPSRLFYHNTDQYLDGQLIFDNTGQASFDLNFQINLLPTLPISWAMQPKAVLEKSEVKIQFSVAQQINNSHFIIEHSLDGSQFKQIGKLDGATNSSNTIDYEFIHRTPSIGTQYYRVKQVDLDGQYSFSEVTSIRKEASAETLIFPNPVDADLMIQSPIEQNVFFHNQLGQFVKSIELTAGSNSIHASEFLTAGIYIARFEDGTIKRIIKQ